MKITSNEVRVIIALVLTIAVLSWVSAGATVQPVYVTPHCEGKTRVVEAGVYCLDKEGDVVSWRPI